MRCECYQCAVDRMDFERLGQFIVCRYCGNKRCPHATNHLHDCTNSNEPGQPGSNYGDYKPTYPYGFERANKKYWAQKFAAFREVSK